MGIEFRNAARVIFPLLLVGCGARGVSQPHASEVVPTATWSASQERQYIDNTSESMIAAFFAENGFAEQGRHRLLGAEIVFWGKDGVVPQDEYLKILDASYGYTRTLGEAMNLEIPSPETNPLQGETFHIGILMTPDTCVGPSPDVTMNQIQASLISASSDSGMAQCEVNAFSFAPEANLSEGNYVSTTHFILATPYFRQATCGGKVPLYPAGLRYCLNDSQVTKAGAGHEFAHQILRSLYGPRRNGPLTISGEDLEESFAQAVEAAIIENELGVPSTR